MLLAVITFLSLMSCYNARIVPRDEEDFTNLQKQKAYSPSNIFLLARNITSPKSRLTHTISVTPALTRKPKKWQVERVTRKQYEVINLLWRKTKIFLNVENTSQESKPVNFTKKKIDLIQGEHQIVFTVRPPISQSLTPSYIEFYYSDDSDDHVEKQEKRDCINSKCQYQNNATAAPNSSFLVFHIKGPFQARTNNSYFSTKQSSIQLPFITPRISNGLVYGPIRSLNTTIPRKILSKCNNKLISNIENTFTAIKPQAESTTLYDKIKFFEQYDKLTRAPFFKKSNKLEFQYNEYDDKDIKINSDNKILLDHVDQSSHEHNEAKHLKKHIIVENHKNSSQSCSIEKTPKPKANNMNISTENQNNMTSLNESIISEKNKSKNVYSYTSKFASWSKYPFAAVYIYEPSQLQCDAASISAHWLVASGSCLSRLKQSPLLGDGRSAFVAYCGDSWWQPERVSYVKYSVVHPWYHPRDQTRRNLYNIGVIQVVTSMMSACSDWAPVALMSHQYIASRKGAEAIALGWGLDRYDTRYAALEFPKASLMLYKSLVFLDSCPGNIGYGKVKRLDEEGGLKNVYCLSLPPYLGEERDPVHGSLLLAGGKLIALYLQEERRPWGEQSAQYTGIWHLIPWVVEVAREPEELESFTEEF